MLRLIFVLVLSSLAACGDDGGQAGDGPSGDGGSGTDMVISAPVFQTAQIPGCAQGGTQSVISAVGGKVAIATLDATTTTTTCTLMNRNPQDVPNYDICYAESSGGGAFNAAVATTQDYIAVTGLGMALDPSGNPAIVFTGGGPAARRCGATEMMMMTGSGGSFGAPTTIAASSQSSALVPDQASQCLQNVCNQGDCTGYWPAIAFDANGVAAVGFRDFHYGTATTDFAFSDVEFAQGPQFAVLTVDVSRGGGDYLRAAYTPSGKPALVHYNGDGTVGNNGIWINHEKSDGTWEAVQITTSLQPAGPQIGFAINQQGLHGVAYYDTMAERLEYVESMDGSTWGNVVDVDTDGNTGQYPSLAFDDAGNPAIAYYRCNDYDPNNQNCDNNKDGLFIALRRNGRWRSYPVSQQSGIADGLYTAIAFSGGKAVIAYQTRTFDAGSNTNTLTLNVAREQ